MNPKKTIGLILLILGVAIGGVNLAKVYDAVPLVERLGAKLRISSFINRTGPKYVMYVAFVAVPIVVGSLLLAAGTKAPAAPAETTGATDSAVWKSQRAEKKAPVQSCNVLQAEVEPRQLWQFDARNG